MVILRSQNKITDFLMILAWASPFKYSLTCLIATRLHYPEGVIKVPCQAMPRGVIVAIQDVHCLSGS